MGEQIIDGAGTGSKAKVNVENRLETFSITESRSADISNRNGKAFILATDFVSLTTTGSFNGMIYVKNSSDENLFIDKLRVCGTSASSSYMQTILIENPTTGNLISDANTGTATSSNLGSSVDFDGLSYVAMTIVTGKLLIYL